MSRTLAPANPRSCTTRRHSVSIFSRFDGLPTIVICTFVLQPSRNLDQATAADASVGSKLRRLAAVELRRSLSQEGGNPFLHISGSGHLRKPFGLKLHLLGK